MRLGLVSEFVYPFRKGGAEKRFYEVATRLASRGHEVHWFGAYEWEGPPSMTYDGVHLHAGARPVDVYTESGRRSVGATVRLGSALSYALARCGISFEVMDLSLYPFFHIFGSRFLRRRTPLVVTWHEYWGEHWREYIRGPAAYVGMQIERRATRIPRRIIATSELVRIRLLDSGVAQSRVVTIHNGVDLAAVERARPIGRGADIVFFGRLKNHKNVDLLLRAVALARRERPELSCMVVGDGPERRALGKLADTLGLGEAVRFTGSLETESEIFSIVKACGLCVNPSLKEGGGNITLLEAQACGVPVMAIRHPLGIDETLIEHGRTGWWVDGAEPAALAAALLEAMKDRGRLESMRGECRRFAGAFDWERIAGQHEETYSEVLAC